MCLAMNFFELELVFHISVIPRLMKQKIGVTRRFFRAMLPHKLGIVFSIYNKQHLFKELDLLLLICMKQELREQP